MTGPVWNRLIPQISLLLPETDLRDQRIQRKANFIKKCFDHQNNNLRNPRETTPDDLFTDLQAFNPELLNGISTPPARRCFFPLPQNTGSAIVR